jgi:signal transduction histidine kinase/FixJ family two-component response regulator/HPt (histidine-containing phosphotransfer) domain-containing protein
MKPFSGLLRILSAAGLLFFLCGCAGVSPKPDSRENAFYIDLNGFPLYAKKGFDPANIAAVPHDAGGSWQVKGPEERKRAAKVRDLGLEENAGRFFLSPFGEKDREYTILIPFVVRPEQYEEINTNTSFQPGISLAALGDNWEIFFNGRLVKSEMHLDDDGQIKSGRSWRNISLPVDRSLFVSGNNILAFHIIGAPHSNTTGLWYKQPYYIDGYQTILKDHNEYPIVAFCAVYFFIGLYHFLLFLSRPKDHYNLYYCFFSILLGIYFLMRSSSAIYGLLPNTNVVFRLENASLYMLLPALSSFLEHFNFGKTLKANRVFFGISIFFTLVQVMFYKAFGEGILYIWQRFVFVEFVYLLGYDMLHVFFRNVKARLKADKRSSSLKIFLITLCRTPQGNIIICASIMLFAAAIDIIDSIIIGHGVVKASPLGIFLFIITTTIIFTRRFGNLFRRLDEMNTLLEKSNLNLEATVRERTRELELQTEVAKSASRAKSDFLARMSHEIRTPLNAVLGLSEVELQGSLPERTRLNLEKIYHSGSHLLEIVNDILDISKIESGNFEIIPAEYELCGVINDVIQINIVRIGLKPVKFKLEIDETIPSKLCGDELRVKQILNNLLSNAFKYTEEGSVRLIINWERKEDSALLSFTVEDTGRGIKKEDLAKLFSEYTQFEVQSNRSIEGTGLGLSITRGLVERMCGNITVESEYGKGSIFRVILPQGIRDEKPVDGEAVENLRNFRFIEDRNQNRGNTFIRSYMPYGKVLVVDDLQTNLDVMTGLLMPYGLTVDTVSKGREAVDLIRAEKSGYDVVFMDHMMPEMDGIEAVRIIRNEIGERKAVIVAVTANAIAGNREMFLENGFNDFISKPIDINQLDMVLNRWIRDKQSEEALKDAENQISRRTEGFNGDLDTEGKRLLEHSIEGVDFAAALKLYGNSGAAYLTILKSFVAHTPLSLERMDAGLASSSPDYTIKAHGLKGTCNAIGAAGTAALAWELELASREGNFGLVRQKHGTLRSQALELTERLKVLLDEWDASRPAEEKEQRAEPERALLVRLSAAAAEFNSNAVEEILGELGRYRYEQGQEFIEQLREKAENFDYDVMQKELTKFLVS